MDGTASRSCQMPDLAVRDGPIGDDKCVKIVIH
jgi:hypothetical protein